MYEYYPTGTCSKKITFDVVDNKVTNVKFTYGCAGNLLGISQLIEGMEVDEVIDRLEGTPCGSKQTSCPDQLAKALKEYKQKNS
ncbi:TSCPD domain-containing protein [Vallitalea longa]|uniref:ribonucleoside-diphosphate reductase n=1 Tax=Vallitalea longa TaxID=2936439 RepID=A0A9W6DEI1_9FIRM|nr:TIGR03905 family TSCPD domain-containing protein [Vallitalea longa]GKX30211.1 TSCPD domain-containing protein [Vallitalea longa]